jgi:hypothetical protein
VSTPIYGAACALAASANDATTPAATRLVHLAPAHDLVHRTTNDTPPIAEPMASRDQADPAAAQRNGPKTSEFSRLRRIGGAQRVWRE